MKSVYAMSHHGFCETMKFNGLNDENVEDRTTMCLIEICGEQDLLYLPHHFTRDHPNVLRLLFDDIDEVTEVKYLDERESKNLYPMTEEQGQQIIDFLVHNRDVQTCIVHCAAGISRSGAVATFIKETFGMHEDVFRLNNRHIHPNHKVLSILRKLYYKGP